MKKLILLVSVIVFFFSCTSLNISKGNNDVEYLVSAINENYPFLQVHLRRDGFDWNNYILSLNDNIDSESSKLDFYSKYLYGLNGHVGFLTNEIFPYYYNVYKENLEKYPHLLPWYNVLNDDKVRKAYNFRHNTKSNNYNTFNFANPIEFKKINESNYVYIKVPSFDDQLKMSEGQKIVTYLKENSNRDKIIIFDISGNSGGSTLFWEDYLVRPLIRQQIKTTQISLYRGGQLSIPFLESIETELIDIANFDQEIENINDLKYYKYFTKTERCLDPINSGIEYNKIIVLMNKDNFSASDAFVNFCKRSNFAILVGQNSTGDGIGFDPILVKLPNSNLVFTIPISAGLNYDGSINYEKGVTPDIYIDESVNSLDYVLNRIDEF